MNERSIFQSNPFHGGLKWHILTSLVQNNLGYNPDCHTGLFANAIISYCCSQLYPCFIYFPVFITLCIAFIRCKKEMSMITAPYTSFFSDTLTLNHLLASPIHVIPFHSREVVKQIIHCFLLRVLSSLSPLSSSLFVTEISNVFLFLFDYQYKDPCSFHSTQ